MSEILEKQKYIVLFTNKLCTIQDRTLKNLIGAVVQYDGVYLFLPVRARNFQVNSVVVPDASMLWHRRLGHPLMKVVSSLPGVASSSMNKKCGVFDCYICFMGKQPRNSFPLSMDKASGLFDLIHCDIWGPNKVSSKISFTTIFSIIFSIKYLLET